jgi:ABC-type sugar transport system substrate-binding protein
MVKKYRFVAALVAVAAVVALLASTAAAGSKSPQASAAKAVKLGLITKFPVDFYFTMVKAAKAWQKTHSNVTVLYAAGKTATDDTGEIAAIQDMVASGVKGIAITPTSTAVIPALNKAASAGVKIVLMDNNLATLAVKSSFVGTNNLKGGMLAGKYLAAHLKAGATLGILQGVPGVAALDDRVTGMLKGLGSLASKIKVVSKLETDCDQTKGAAAAQTQLTANQHLTAIYAACGPPMLGAIQSVKNAGIKPGGIILVAFDGLPAEVTAIKAGQENATVAQFPAKMGSVGLATLLKAVQGKKVPKNIDTGTALITKANASKFG